MKQFMKQLKTNPNELEIPNKRHNGVATKIGKAQPVQFDPSAQKRALKQIEKREGR